MPRPKKKKIDINHESVVSLLQEIYNECVEQRNTAIRIQNKMISYMKEATDMTLIGPVLKEQQKIIDSVIEKKLQLTATFRPLGLLGRLYWYSVLPFHGFIFEGMINQLINSKK